MHVVGICRFSLLGRGDWKAYQGASDAEVAAIADQQAATLFAPDRIERRLATLQHLTLASLQAQTDQDFTLIVLAPETMPAPYKQRLSQICSAVPQVVLRFFPLIHVVDAQKAVLAELGMELKTMVQFRLDDDDAVCTTFVERKRQIASRLVAVCTPLALSFRSVLFCSAGGEQAGIYAWDSPFFSAGAALYHPTRSIFSFGHFALMRRFASIVIPDGMSLATHNGQNDTLFDADRIRRQGFVRMDKAEISKTCASQFPFLTAKGKGMAGLPDAG